MQPENQRAGGERGAHTNGEEFMKRSFILTAMAAAAVAAAAQTAAAQSFDGKTVEYTIPFSESGGSAQWANFYAPLLSEALPGAPTVVVRYRPGAGSTEGANWFQGQQDEGDGLTIFGDSGSTKFPYLLGDPRVRYEYRDWQPVLASATGGVVYLPPDLGERFDGDMDELKDEPYLYGSQGATTLDLVPLLAFKMLGMQVDPVFGVEGRGDGRLMFERGEANIDYQTSAAYLANVQPLVDDGLAVPIFTWGALDEQGNIVRDPTFPDLPSLRKSARRRRNAKPKVWPGTPTRHSSSRALPTRKPSSCHPRPRRRWSIPMSRRCAKSPLPKTSRIARSRFWAPIRSLWAMRRSRRPNRPRRSRLKPSNTFSTG